MKSSLVIISCFVTVNHQLTMNNLGHLEETKLFGQRFAYSRVGRMENKKSSVLTFHLLRQKEQNNFFFNRSRNGVTICILSLRVPGGAQMSSKKALLAITLVLDELE
jgi:hypothetical protein